jgi:CHAT domain-containing protein
MEPHELAARLVDADASERPKLLAAYRSRLDVRLAWALKDLCLHAWTRDPARTIAAAVTLAAVADSTADDEVRALASWAAGYAALTQGGMEAAIQHIDDARARFTALARPAIAANTQVLMLYPLAMLGRFDDAIRCGLAARDVLDAHGDSGAVARIEANLGNIYRRREQHREAERWYRAARERFLALDDPAQLAQINNNLAMELAAQHRFADAERLHLEALAQAEATGLAVTQAEIECNLGALALYQGRYDRALDFLERSRRRYATLGVAHRAALTERDMADAYLELNLAAEAAAIYARVTQTFAELGLRTDQAWALAHHARACLAGGDTATALALLAEAAPHFAAEGNILGGAVVALTEAGIHHAHGDYPAAVAAARRAERPFRDVDAWGRLLLARWLRGDSLRALGRRAAARRLLLATLRHAERQMAPQVAVRCHTSLGLVAAAAGDHDQAEASYRAAVTVIEAMRAPLPAEEFRASFVADKLTPYSELVRLCLEDDRSNRVTEALAFVERARARALVDLLGGALQTHHSPRDATEAALTVRLEEWRGRLNRLYSQVNQPSDGDESRAAAVHRRRRRSIRECEDAILDLMRRLQHRTEQHEVRGTTFDLDGLRHALGADTALVEYFSLDGRLLAFVVTDEGVALERDLATEADVEEALAQARFQIDTLRYGAARLRSRLDQLTRRARHHLAILYDLLLRPLAPRLDNRRLVVSPHRALHYVPFHALHDGASYVIEQREVSYTPSATVLQHCLEQPFRSTNRALLVGVADAATPRVREEIAALAPLFPHAVALEGDEATTTALAASAAAADVIHLACHGSFRPDNPLFSALRLADGWLTVRDAGSLNLAATLVTLSACETGISAVAPGDELIGLARGFIAAGATSLLVSLWTVDDAATARLMKDFYRRLQSGGRPAAALRAAQRRLLAEEGHPFFWAPFVLLGRW